MMTEKDSNECLNICVDSDGREDPCCKPKCCLKKLGILVFPGNSSAPIVDPSRISYSFRLSVNHDVDWQPVVNKSVQRCYDHVVSTSVEFDVVTCIGIPSALNRIIDCSHKENFLKCPKWNQDDENCVPVYKYIENDC